MLRVAVAWVRTGAPKVSGEGIKTKLRSFERLEIKNIWWQFGLKKWLKQLHTYSVFRGVRSVGCVECVSAAPVFSGNLKLTQWCWNQGSVWGGAITSVAVLLFMILWLYMPPWRYCIMDKNFNIFGPHCISFKNVGNTLSDKMIMISTTSSAPCLHTTANTLFWTSKL